MSEIKSDLDDQIKVLEENLKKATFEGNDLKIHLEVSDKKLKEKVSVAETLKIKLTAASESLSLEKNNMRKLKNEHKMLLLRADRLDTMVDKYET